MSYTPYTNIELLTKFKNYEVCDLSEPEIEQFVRKQIAAPEKEIADKIIEAINTDHNSSYITYLSNPLLLSMFILTFQTYSNVPPKKSAFYRQVFDSLFYLHDSVSKLSFAREKKSKLGKEDFEYVLKLFSFITFFKEIFAFEDSFLNNTLNQIKEKKKNLSFDNQLLIEDLQVAICILNKEGLDYVFPHRSLQEYFASLYIVSLDSINKVEIYRRILHNILKNDFIELLIKDNFYTLLTEQDYIGVVKHLTIPFLEKVNEDFKINSNNPKSIDSLIGAFYHYINSFHNKFSETEELKQLLMDYIQSRHDIYTNAMKRLKNSHITFTKLEQETLDKLISDFSRQVKPIILKTIRNLKNFLEEETKSDTGIIDLISAKL